MASENQPATEIVVGIDGSAHSAHALRWALSFAAHRAEVTGERSTVCPVAVWQAPLLVEMSPLLHHGPKVEALRDSMLVEAQHVIDEVLLDDTDVEVREVELVQGAAGPVLVERSKTAALLVIGCRGQGALRSIAFGSVSSHCISALQAPTVAVPLGGVLPHGGSPPAIVVGINGSLGSDNAAVWARTEFPTSDITLLQAWKRPAMAHVEPAGREVNFEHGARHEFERHLARIDTLVPNGARPFKSRLFVDEDPASVLSDQLSADGESPPGLLALGAQEFHGLRRVVLGSVAQAVLHDLGVPTVFVGE